MYETKVSVDRSGRRKEMVRWPEVDERRQNEGRRFGDPVSSVLEEKKGTTYEVLRPADGMCGWLVERGKYAGYCRHKAAGGSVYCKRHAAIERRALVREGYRP